MKKKWIAIIGSGVLVTGLAVAGVSLADSDHAEIRNGTIRVEISPRPNFAQWPRSRWIGPSRKPWPLFRAES